MSSTLDLYINTSNPARRSLVQGFNSLSSPPTPEFVLRDNVVLRIHFMTVTSGSRTGVTQDLGDPTITFAAKAASNYVTATSYLFTTSSLYREDTDPNDVFYTAELDLNTAEFVGAFTGGAATVALKIEVQIDNGGDIQTVAQADAIGIFDVIRGGEASPTPASPAYPSAPIANTLLGGNSAGTDWVQRNASALRSDLGLGRHQSAAPSNSTGDTTLTPDAATEHYSAILTVTGVARTSNIVLATAGRIAGDIAQIRYALPTTTGIVINLRNATAGGTILDAVTTDGTGDDATVTARFNGSAWELLSSVYPA